ncbi:MAG: GNAT family N-acetyltransferase [Candidatus Woesearchaeota archaeon]|nr:GNAT family N-acetyltransferase [Candidatus Woesearchaeota archaeon]
MPQEIKKTKKEKKIQEVSVYTTADAGWNQYVDAAPAPDIYFRAEYARIYETSYTQAVDSTFGGKALLFVLGTKKEFVALPVLKRPIPGTELFDLCSPYGYSGPLVKAENPAAVVAEFYAALERYAQAEGIVSAFVRFNPVLNNHREEQGAERINTTVIVDLRKTAQELVMEMDKKARTAMRKAQREGVIVETIPCGKGSEKEQTAVHELTLLYIASMRKRNAAPHYFFPQIFFENTVEMLGKSAVIFVARYRNQPISAAIFMHAYGNMHYHFSGIDPEYQRLYPTNLLLMEAAMWGKKNGCTVLHLGGGTSSSDQDPLFRFKAAFARGRSEYYVKKIIFDQKKYDALANKRKEELRQQGKEPKQAFFPAYRG